MQNENLEFENLSLPQAPAPEEPSSRKLLRRLAIVAFGFAAFLFFLVMKLPEAKIQNLILAHMRILAQENGFTFNADKVRVGILFGPSLTMTNAEIKSLEDPSQVLKVPFLRVRPSLLSLATGKRAASFKMEIGSGTLSGAVSMGSTSMGMDLDFDAVNVGALTVLKAYLPIELASGTLDGSINVDMDAESPDKSTGKVDLKILKLQTPPQQIYGFTFPKLAVNESVIEGSINQGLFTIKTFMIGKDPKVDDIVAQLTGSATVDRSFMNSKLNTKLQFQLSENIIKTFPFLDSMLSKAKTPDGKFAYKISGPVYGPDLVPGG